MSYPPSPFVWFLLLDSVTGLPYKGTNANKVSVSTSADVADFREAAHLKNSSILTGITSAQLTVYKNKAAFDKRNAVVDDGKEEPLDPTESLGLLGSKEDMLVVVVPSSSSFPELDQLDQEIKALENSEEYKTLAYKNRVWAVPKPTEQERGEWQLLNEKLAYLKKTEDFYRNAILSMNAHSVKKSDKTRKEYKRDTAIKDERLLLSDVAIKMWERFEFDCVFEDGPSFGDLKRAAGFGNCKDVRDYFQRKARGEVQEDDIKDSLTKEAWIWLIGLNQRVNGLLHDTLITNKDGSLRLVLEHDVYEGGRKVAEELVRTFYGSSKKVDIKDASSDSSSSP
eukprot:CCRYP_019353-RA/>CCRYP_019353-RA protein AED:0.08 eAED:0.08 QI:0/-1/0/1/-1/1/1/0/338